MATVNNIPRVEAINWETPLDPDKNIWISIHEPEKSHVTNSILDRCPNLKLQFWDIVEPIIDYSSYDSKWLYPPTNDDAKQIVDFLLEHRDKNVLVNCKAGVSRSSAVSQFCSDYLGYEWLTDGYNRAVPNELLYNMMVEYYGKPKKTKILDKRRFTDFGNRTMITVKPKQ